MAEHFLQSLIIVMNRDAGPCWLAVHCITRSS